MPASTMSRRSTKTTTSPGRATSSGRVLPLRLLGYNRRAAAMSDGRPEAAACTHADQARWLMLIIRELRELMHDTDGTLLPGQREAPDVALGRCPLLIQCHREIGHAGEHEAREVR